MSNYTSDEHTLEERLRRHFQQSHPLPPAINTIWTRLEPQLLAEEDLNTGTPSRFPRVFKLLARKPAVSEQEQQAFREKETLSNQQPDPSKIPAKRGPLNQRLRYALEAAIALLLIVGIVSGWLIVTKVRDMQGTGPNLFTYLSQPGEVLYYAHWTPDSANMVFILETTTTNHYRFFVWNAENLQSRQTLDVTLPASMNWMGMPYSPDGHYALIRSNGTSPNIRILKLANILTGQQKEIYRGSYADQNAPEVVFSHNGKMLAFVASDGSINVWNISTNTLTRMSDSSFHVQSQGLTAVVAWSGDDRRFMVESRLKTGKSQLEVWNVQNGQHILHILATDSMSLFYDVPQQGANFAGLSPDGSRILTYNLQTGRLVERNSQTLEPLITFDPVITRPGSVINGDLFYWQSDGKSFFQTQANQIIRWSATTGKRLNIIPAQHALQGAISISPQDARYLTINRPDNTLEIWDMSTGVKINTIKPDITIPPFGAGISSLPDRQIYLECNDNAKHGQIYDARTGKLIVRYAGDNAFLPPDAHYIATRTLVAREVGNNSVAQDSINVFRV